MPDPGKTPTATLVLTAKYTDDGTDVIKALTGTGIASLNSSNYVFKGTEKTNGFTSFKYNGINLMILPAGEGWFEVDDIDLSGVKSINLSTFWQAAPSFGFNFDLRVDTPDGKVVGKGSMPTPAKDQKGGVVHLTVNPVTDGQMHKLFFIYKPIKPGSLTAGVTGISFGAK
jgi:cytochrome c